MPAAKVTSTVEDLSTRVNSNSAYNTAIVVAAPVGPINKPIKISSQTAFLRTFTPYERLELDWDTALFEAYKYLETQNGLYVVRAADTSKIKASACLIPLEGNSYPTDKFNGLTYAQFENLEQGNDVLSFATNSEEDEEESTDISNYACIIYASSPSKYGNDIRLQIITDQAQVRVAGAFIIRVFVKGNLQESFTVSLSKSVKDGYGANCYIKDVLESSKYIRAFVFENNLSEDIDEYQLVSTYKIDGEEDNVETVKTTVYKKHIDNSDINNKIIDSDLYYIDEDGEKQDYSDSITTDEVTDGRLYLKDYYTNPHCIDGSNAIILIDDFKNSYKEYKVTFIEQIKQEIALPEETDKDTYVALSGGESEDTVTVGQRITALNTLGNMHDVSIQLIMDGDITDEAYHRAIRNLTDKRKNSCHGIISTRFEDERKNNVLTAIANYRKYQLNMNSYSMEMYTPHQKYYDEFNDRYMWLSPGPFVASRIMQVAQERGWHWAVAGYNRGIIDSVDVYKAFEEGDVDELSDMQVNTIIKDPGSGNVIWDELTLWNQAADLQDAHISRWVNIYLRPALEEMLRSFLFEFNDEETRNLVIKKIETFMEPQKSARACYAYRIICDDSNNTDDDIENNRLNSWLYIKPTKIAKWITQKIILTPYSTNLEDLEF